MATTHILLIDHENTVWAAGNNKYSQLGRGFDKTTCLKGVRGLPPIKLAAAGSEHSLFLDFEGNVWATVEVTVEVNGVPFSERLATRIVKIPTTFVAQSIACGSNHSYILDVDGCVWSCGTNGFGQLGIGEKSYRNYFSLCKVVPDSN